MSQGFFKKNPRSVRINGELCWRFNNRTSVLAMLVLLGVASCGVIVALVFLLGALILEEC